MPQRLPPNSEHQVPEPLELPDLGLPSDYEPDRDSRYIPSDPDLQQAAIRALDDLTSLVIMHGDTPEDIARQLDTIVATVRVASAVKGDHLAKAIRLGLALELRFWSHDNRLHEWPGLIMELLHRAAELELSDPELKAELYRAWSIYHFAAHNQAQSETALEKALEYADDSGREDLRLLARAERFNTQIEKLTLDQAQLEAQGILADARRIGFRYVEGRVFLTLARGYQKAALPRAAFEAAQQAFVYFCKPEIVGMQAGAVIFMLGNLQYMRCKSTAFRGQLLSLLERLKKRSVNTWFSATFAHLSANEAFYQGDYAEARRWALIAGLEYRHMVDQAYNYPRIMHLLGMIDTKLERFPAAERHLRAACERYLKNGNLVNAIHTQHALAWVPYTAGDYARSLDMLEDTVDMIDTLPEPATRESLRELVGADIEQVRRHLRNGHQ